MKRALIIVGPTAVGKTALVYDLYRKFPSVLISADSIQVLRRADIISGKDSSCPTELLDVVDSTEQFSVRDFTELIRPIVRQAFDEDKIPIIVGGAGFYIDALFGKIDTINIPPDLELRTELNKLSIKKLQQKLAKLDPARFQNMNNSDINNKRRVIRAIEITTDDRMIDHTKRPRAIFKEDEVLMIGLKTSIENLRERIALRVEERLAAGALKEAQELFKNYERLSSQLKTANGYKELFDFLSDRTTFKEAVRKWITAEGQLAKNQMTYFRRNKNIVWFDIDKKGFEQEISRLVRHELDS